MYKDIIAGEIGQFRSVVIPKLVLIIFSSWGFRRNPNGFQAMTIKLCAIASEGAPHSSAAIPLLTFFPSLRWRSLRRPLGFSRSH